MISIRNGLCFQKRDQSKVGEAKDSALLSSRDAGLLDPLSGLKGSGPIPGSGRSPGEGNGNPLQYSCLENPMDREAW